MGISPYYSRKCPITLIRRVDDIYLSSIIKYVCNRSIKPQNPEILMVKDSFLAGGDKMECVTFTGKPSTAIFSRKGKQISFPLGKGEVSIVQCLAAHDRKSFDALGQFLAGLAGLEYRFDEMWPNKATHGFRFSCTFVSLPPKGPALKTGRPRMKPKKRKAKKK
jgi:hypothetical protein